MVDPLTLGVGLFVLLAGPFVAYALLSLHGFGGWRSGGNRESTVPASVTGNYPSRTIPGGNKRGEH